MSTKTMNQVIANYFKTQPVLKAWLFGSFARGEETPRSDVDILMCSFASAYKKNLTPKFVLKTGTPGDYAAKLGKISELCKQMTKNL